MNTVCRVAATVGALAAQAARVGDDESMYANSTIAEPDEEKTKKLNKWLNDNTLPSGDQEKMDGSVDDPIWAYMKSDCFQGRYRTAVKYMSQKKCKTAIEVGGYLTPLDKFILEAKKEGKGKGDSYMPTKYVNIDPSMKEAKVEKKHGLVSYHLPMTLADFFSSETTKLRGEMGIKADPSDTCSLVFGIWDPHYKNDEDQAAMETLMRKSLWAAVETSEYAKYWLEHTSAEVCEKMGLTHVKDEDADCREALKGQKPDTSILRHMKFFERKEGKKDTKETSKDSDDEDSDDPKPIKKGGKKNTKKTSKDDDDDVDSLASEESEDDESSAEEADEEASSKKEGKAKDSLVSDETEDEETEAAEMTSDEEEEATNKKREKESSDSEEGESEKEADSSEDEEEASSKKSKKAKDESEDEEADASEESSEADSEAEESETEEDDAEDEEDEASSKKSKKISKH